MHLKVLYSTVVMATETAFTVFV